MKRLEKVVAQMARDYADYSINQRPCGWIFYQPKIAEEMKQRLKETRKKN